MEYFYVDWDECFQSSPGTSEMNSGCFSALGPPPPCVRLEVTLNAVEVIALDLSNPFATVPHGELLVKMEISTGIIRDY